jgi:hypothetical protein
VIKRNTDRPTFVAAKELAREIETRRGSLKIWKTYEPANAWGEEKPVFRVSDRKPEGDWIGPMISEYEVNGYSTED